MERMGVAVFVISLTMVVYVMSVFVLNVFGITTVVNLVGDRVKLRCPRCGSGQTYYRFKTDDVACRSCGKKTSMAALKMIMKELEENKRELERKRIDEIEKEVVKKK